MSFDPSNFDPTKHGDGVSSILPPGEYVFMVRTFKRAQRKGKHQIDFAFKAVLDSKQQRVPNSSSLVWETVTIAENAIWRLANLCAAIGHSNPFNINDDGELAGATKGHPFKAQIVHEKYQGSNTTKLKKYTAMTKEDFEAFKSALEDMVVDEAMDTSNNYGDYSNQDDPGYVPDYSDEDIPF